MCGCECVCVGGCGCGCGCVWVSHTIRDRMLTSNPKAMPTQEESGLDRLGMAGG